MNVLVNGSNTSVQPLTIDNEMKGLNKVIAHHKEKIAEKIEKLKYRPVLAAGSTLVEHQTTDPKIKGLNLVAAWHHAEKIIKK